MPKAKYVTLIRRSETELKKDQAELDAKQASNEMKKQIMDIGLNLDNLNRDLANAKCARPFNAGTITSILDNIALAERQLDQLMDIESELF